MFFYLFVITNIKKIVTNKINSVVKKTTQKLLIRSIKLKNKNNLILIACVNSTLRRLFYRQERIKNVKSFKALLHERILMKNISEVTIYILFFEYSTVYVI